MGRWQRQSMTRPKNTPWRHLRGGFLLKQTRHAAVASVGVVGVAEVTISPTSFLWDVSFSITKRARDQLFPLGFLADCFKELPFKSRWELKSATVSK